MLDISSLYDFVENSVLRGRRSRRRRAVNINTVDEVPDSSWFTNPHRTRRWLIRLVPRSPHATGTDRDLDDRLGQDGRRVARLHRPRRTGQIYFIKFDPPSNPEMASGAEVISTKFFHAFGYHVPENYVATFRREELSDRRGRADRRRTDGGVRPDRGPREPVEAGGAQRRRHLSRPREQGARRRAGRPVPLLRDAPDDPNDIFPHEHRRELRALRVFAAWLNHDDSRSINTLDMLVATARQIDLRHNLIDFGSTLGSGTIQAQSAPGNEFIWRSRSTLITMLTLGFYVRPWIKVPYPDIPAVGRIESAYFRPRTGSLIPEPGVQRRAT